MPPTTKTISTSNSASMRTSANCRSTGTSHLLRHGQRSSDGISHGGTRVGDDDRKGNATNRRTGSSTRAVWLTWTSYSRPTAVHRSSSAASHARRSTRATGRGSTAATVSAWPGTDIQCMVPDGLRSIRGSGRVHLHHRRGHHSRPPERAVVGREHPTDLDRSRRA